MFARGRPPEHLCMRIRRRKYQKSASRDLLCPPLVLRLLTGTDVQTDAESRKLKVTTSSGYQGVCPFYEKTLNTIYSYSYRGDSALRNFILCHCAKPRKSPSIGELQEMWPFYVPIRCGDW